MPKSVKPEISAEDKLASTLSEVALGKPLNVNNGTPQNPFRKLARYILERFNAKD